MNFGHSLQLRESSSHPKYRRHFMSILMRFGLSDSVETMLISYRHRPS
jgi:hypothetical protein